MDGFAREDEVSVWLERGVDEECVFEVDGDLDEAELTTAAAEAALAEVGVSSADTGVCILGIVYRCLKL